MHEIEVKILEVNKEQIENKLAELRAKLIQDTKLTVEWFRPKDVYDGQDPWYLRIRKNSEGKAEATWKSKREIVGIAKKVKEINMPVSDPLVLAEMFEAIGLVKYAFQEKFRKSWVYENFRFDLDQYPGMPAYLEIEAGSEDLIKKAIGLLNLENLETSSEGERVLIENHYNLNWHLMKF